MLFIVAPDGHNTTVFLVPFKKSLTHTRNCTSYKETLTVKIMYFNFICTSTSYSILWCFT